MTERINCEDIGFAHLWEDCIPQVVLLSYPPQYPPKERRCLNCGKCEVESVQAQELDWHINHPGNGACDRVGFRHRWFDGRPLHIRICANCGLSMEQRVIRPELHIWLGVTP